MMTEKLKVSWDSVEVSCFIQNMRMENIDSNQFLLRECYRNCRQSYRMETHKIK